MIPVTDLPVLSKLCEVLGDPGSGLTHREIDTAFQELGIVDRSGKRFERGMEVRASKANKLYVSLRARQDRDRSGNYVGALLEHVMAPARYVDDFNRFRERMHRLNDVLVFAGLTLREDGRLAPTSPARTLSEAQQRATRLRQLLSERGVHGDVLAMCRAELLEQDYFHAVLEATKSLADKIRAKTGLSGDGTSLIEAALARPSGRMPYLAFNTLRTTSEESEHRGIEHLLKGLVATARNPTAHEPRVHWAVVEQDAVDLLTLASYLHRRLDEAVVLSPGRE